MGLCRAAQNVAACCAQAEIGDFGAIAHAQPAPNAAHNSPGNAPPQVPGNAPPHVPGNALGNSPANPSPEGDLPGQPLVAESDNEKAEQQAGPLTERQRELESISGEIARALQQQASQPPAMQTGTPPDEKQQALDEEATRRLSEAADHVGTAQSLMKNANV